VQRGRGVEEGQKKFADLYLCAFREIRSGSRTILAYARAPRRSSLLASSVLLATTGGFLDGFTYVGHGHVFANAMTGNVVLLGINCIFGSWQTGFRHLPPILAFLVGTSAARFLTLSFCQLAAFVSRPSRFSSSRSRASSCSLLPPATRDIWITTSIALIASMQMETFRDVNGRSYNSTFTTGNLRTLSEGAFDWFFSGRSPASASVRRHLRRLLGRREQRGIGHDTSRKSRPLDHRRTAHRRRISRAVRRIHKT